MCLALIKSSKVEDNHFPIIENENNGTLLRSQLGKTNRPGRFVTVSIMSSIIRPPTIQSSIFFSSSTSSL